MRVTILCHDLSNNALGRAFVLAQLIERTHEVEIVGPKLRGDVWGPLRSAYGYHDVDSSLLTHRFLFDIPSLTGQISGDVVFAIKPRISSYGIGLYQRLREHRPVILDIDDWESGLIYGRSRNLISALLRGIPALAHHTSLYYTRILEAIAPSADRVTVSNQFLQERFGGTIIRHARDTARFDPTRFDKLRIREELNLPVEDHIILFAGTPRPHKGLEELAEAVAHIGRDDVKTIIVGEKDSDYVQEIYTMGGDNISLYGQQPFNDIPKWIAAADVIAIPQRDTPSTRGQIPAKLFDAMAMGKAVVATDVCDIGRVLDGCGKVVEPGSPQILREALIDFIDNPDLQAEFGAAARERCVNRYSYDALAPRIAGIVDSVI
jgi:glycosyltransferase involved in cell wall biosynthesis